MSYYPDPDRHIRDKVKAVLDLTNCATKKNYIMLKKLLHFIYLLNKLFLL